MRVQNKRPLCLRSKAGRAPRRWRGLRGLDRPLPCTHVRVPVHGLPAPFGRSVPLRLARPRRCPPPPFQEAARPGPWALSGFGARILNVHRYASGAAASPSSPKAQSCGLIIGSSGESVQAPELNRRPPRAVWLGGPGRFTRRPACPTGDPGPPASIRLPAGACRSRRWGTGSARPPAPPGKPGGSGGTPSRRRGKPASASPDNRTGSREGRGTVFGRRAGWRGACGA